MSVTVDGTAYTYDLDDQWRSVRWDLFAARTMVAALPAIAGEGCTERACTVDKVAEAMVRRRAECDRVNAEVPRVAHRVFADLRNTSQEAAGAFEACVQLNPAWEFRAWEEADRWRELGGVLLDDGAECVAPFGEGDAGVGAYAFAGGAAAPPHFSGDAPRRETYAAVRPGPPFPRAGGARVEARRGPLTKLKGFFGSADPARCAHLVQLAGPPSTDPRLPDDAAPAVCLDDLEPPCVVYSFGVADSWTFDDFAAARGCEVFSFDPAMARQGAFRRGALIRFEPVGVGNETLASYAGSDSTSLFGGAAAGYPVETLADIMARHAHPFVDVVRMDIEGAEWPVLAEMLRGSVRRIGQLLLEAHFWDEIRDNASASSRKAVEALPLLEALPLGLFAHAVNPYDATFLDEDLTRIHELGLRRPPPTPRTATWAVLGTGLGGFIVASTVSAHASAELAVVGTRSSANCAAKWGLPTSHCVGYKEAATAFVDVVSVHVPTAFKMAWALEACVNGSARVVLVDKPFPSLAAVAELRRACARRGAHVADGAAFPYSTALSEELGGRPRRASYAFHLDLWPERRTTRRRPPSDAVDYRGAPGRLDPAREPSGIFGDLAYYAFLGLGAALGEAMPDAVECRAHRFDAETGAAVDVSGRLGANATFSVSYAATPRDELEVLFEAGGVVASGVVGGGDVLNVLRHRFADGTTSDAVFERTQPRHGAAAKLVDALSKLSIGDRSSAAARGAARRAERAQALVDACARSAATYDGGADRRGLSAAIPRAAEYLRTGVAALDAPRLPSGLLAELRLGLGAALALRPQSVVYDDTQRPRLKTSLCSRWEGTRRPCAALGQSALSTKLVDAMRESVLPAAVAAVGAPCELLSVSVDVAGGLSRAQHPHWDPVPAQWDEKSVHYVFVPLADVDEANGPLEAWPSTSDRRGDALAELAGRPVAAAWRRGGGPLQAWPADDEAEAYFRSVPSATLVAKAGLAYLARPIVWHRGSANSKFTARFVATVILREIPGG